MVGLWQEVCVSSDAMLQWARREQRQQAKVGREGHPSIHRPPQTTTWQQAAGPDSPTTPSRCVCARAVVSLPPSPMQAVCPVRASVDVAGLAEAYPESVVFFDDLRPTLTAIGPLVTPQARRTLLLTALAGRC